MERYVINEIYADGYERYAIIEDVSSRKFVVHFLEYSEYLENNEISQIKKTGDIFKGNIKIDLVCVSKKTNKPIMFQQLIPKSSHIEAIVEVVELVDDYSLYALTAFSDNKILIEFENIIDYRIGDMIYVEGSLEIE